MIYRIETALSPAFTDPAGFASVGDIRDSGVDGVSDIRVVRVFEILSDMPRDRVHDLAKAVFADPVIEEYTLNDHFTWEDNEAAVIEVRKKRGVMDPVALSAEKAISDLGYSISGISTITQYVLFGDLSEVDLESALKCLHNEQIEEARLGFFAPDERRYAEFEEPEFRRVDIDILSADDEKLIEISRSGQLSLSLAEMRYIRDFFAQSGRNPTDAELETIAQTWSEHCKHKTFNGVIDFNGEKIDSLMKSYIRKVTDELAKPWCLSVFKDNSGVIEFDESRAVCFKVETHNHPSSIEPYGGAATGIGGVIRDIMGTGLGAKPILSTDVFCFAPPDISNADLPKGALHPVRTMKGVVAGVRDYGNRMGIPTVNGAVYFDKRYVGNPLVYCGTVGIMGKNHVEKEPRKGDYIVVAGGRTGRDGIHGVTFASIELTDKSEEISSGAVQIGNPITEKKLLDAQLIARDRGLYTAVTDCGGGGLSSAVGEMGEELGVDVELSNVPLKYAGLSYYEIWISEAQERMIFAVPPEKVDELLEVFDAEDVEATVLGRFTGDGKLVLRYRDNVVCDLEMAWLHAGPPRWTMTAEFTEPAETVFDFAEPEDYAATLKKILSSYSVASKEWVIRQYDHEVQGASVVKPWCGVNSGPTDAAVAAPVYGETKGIAVGCGINPLYGDADAYRMAVNVIDEALRNIVAVGGDPEKTALLDNFSWGSPERPELLGQLVRACQGCYDAATAFGTPFISGKDSFYNEYSTDAGTIAIPNTLLVSAISVVEDISICATADLKTPGNYLYLVGLTKPEIGASEYVLARGHSGGVAPGVDLTTAPATMKKMHEAIKSDLVRACHDLSEGGLGAALAEAALASTSGCEIDLSRVPTEGRLRDDYTLFSESASRFLVEVTPEGAGSFEAGMAGTVYARIGEVDDTGKLKVRSSTDGKLLIDESVTGFEAAWKKPLAW